MNYKVLVEPINSTYIEVTYYKDNPDHPEEINFIYAIALENKIAKQLAEKILKCLCEREL